MTKRTAEMIGHDLKAEKIAYKTSEGVIDFYATRVSYISNLVASGASVKTCQTLARHSTPVLTIGVYAKASLHDIRGAVEALPDLTLAAPAREALAATGTESDSGRGATPGASPVPVETAQTATAQGLSVVGAAELKSSPGEPGCGFESHRRYFDQTAKNRPGTPEIEQMTRPHVVAHQTPASGTRRHRSDAAGDRRSPQMSTWSPEVEPRLAEVFEPDRSDPVAPRPAARPPGGRLRAMIAHRSCRIVCVDVLRSVRSWKSRRGEQGRPGQSDRRALEQALEC
jgi:hypothetical protein